MSGELEKVKKYLEDLDEDNIIFKNHFYERTLVRPIDEELVKKYLKKPDSLKKVELQKSRREGEEKFKLWFKLSNRYFLVLITVKDKKHLNIITGWNTNRRWQKQMQK